MIGRPERLLTGLRAALTWLGMAASLAVPALVLPRLAPWARANVGSWHLRVVLGVSLFLGLASLVYRLFGALVLRLHAGRVYGLEDGCLVIGEARVWGTPLTRPGPVLGPSHRIAWGSVKRIFTRELAWGAAPSLALGLWYLGEDGRGREIWLLLEPGEGARLAGEITRATGLMPSADETRGPAAP